MKVLRTVALLLLLPLISGACSREIPARIPAASTDAPPPATAVPTEPTAARPTPATEATGPVETREPPAAPTATPASSAPRSTADRLEQLGGHRCPDSQFTCVTLTVPLDHFDAHSSGTIDVTYAVLPATGQRKGMWVVALGGPGSSGLALADSYTAAYDPSIAERFDIVFYDQRGMGASGGIQCPAAAAEYYRSEGRADTPEQEAATIASARAFAQACVKQIGETGRLPYLGTRQAVEDLEAFRSAMGEDKLWLYGESYGTQFAQTYAAAHGDRLAGLILDGTVDLTRTGIEYASEAVLAFEEVLSQTLAACMADEACAADTNGHPSAAYDALMARVAQRPAALNFPLANSKTARREFARGDLDTATAGFLSAPDARMLLLRALAYSAQGDLAAYARLAYSALGMDAETLEIMMDASYSDAAYYAVTCNDYAYFAGSPDARAAAFMRAGNEIDAAAPRLSAIFYGDLPCVFWPAGPQDALRPAPLTAEGIPTLVLGATADPLTPLANGRRVYSRLADGYFIITEGGAHVTFARGNACPDALVTAFLVKGELPAQRETACAGVVADAYAPIAPGQARLYANPLEAMQAAEIEITHLPEYYYWDGVTKTAVGCHRGGSLAFEPMGANTRMTLKNCAFSQGLALTGQGEYDDGTGQFTLEVTVGGVARGKLSYTRDGNGDTRVVGTYGGKKVDLAD